MKKRNPIIAFLLAAIMTGGWCEAAQFNGHDLSAVAGEGIPAGKSQLARDEVLLIPAGIRELAATVNASGDTLADYFAARGFFWLGSVGPDAGLVSWDGGKSADLPARTVRLAAANRVTDGLVAYATRGTSPESTLVVHFAGEGRNVVDTVSGGPASAEVTGVKRETGRGRLGLRVYTSDLPALVAEFAALPEVYAIQPGGGARLQNATARRIVQSATTTTGGETIWAYGLHGEGQIIAILDTGADPLNCYLAESDASLPPVVQGDTQTAGDSTRRKIIVYDMLYTADDPLDGLSAYESQGHGTAVSGNALGSKTGAELDGGDAVYNGVAPAAQVVVQDGGEQTDDCADLPALGCPVIDLTAILEQAYFQGARIHNNSWGDNENAIIYPQLNIYTAACTDVDDMSWRNPDFLVVCAAGNSGNSGDDTVASPSTAKNAVSVAGIQNPAYDSIINFSSRGWAIDARIKPDVAAPARTVTSRWNSTATSIHCTTGLIQGTSMASPITAGSCALIRQYYAQGFHPTGTATPADAIPAPSAALIKATLINSAAPVASEPLPPSRRQGWGRVFLDDALHFDGEARKLVAVDEPAFFASSLDASREFLVSSGGNIAAGDIRITLVYTDYPATAGANPAIVNDLDLEVEDSLGTIYRGNQFDAITGYSVTTGGPDTINNVEMVRLPPTADIYTVRIIPRNIIEPDQGFAVVVTGDVTSLPPSSINETWLIE